MFTFNGISSETKLIVNKIKRSLSPPVIRNYLEIPGKSGALLGRTQFGVRKFEFDITVLNANQTDYNNLLREISSWLYTEKPTPLTINKDSSIYYLGVLDGTTNLEEISVLGEGTLIFLCPDPFGYSSETSLSFTNDSASPNVEGTYKTSPRIVATFTTAASEFKVTHTQSGKYVRVIRSFLAGDVLEIDCSIGKIIINGVVTMSILDWANSEFFHLDPGAQALEVLPTSVADVTIYWKSRWL
jgi:predicted phage tail component-like protein